MVSEFSTFGSCASRIIFNSSVNTGYKQFFHINDSVELVTLISLMSTPISFDESTLDAKDKFDNECVYNDLTKSFLNFLKKNTIEYLIMDTFFDVDCDVIVYDEKSFLTDSVRLRNTSYARNLTQKRHINIFKNYEEYMCLWKNACDSFFDFLSENCPNIKVILNCSRGAEQYLDENGNIHRFNNFKYINESNKLRDILEMYILENFDVEVLPFDDTTLAYKNHFAHLHTVHYEDKYYTDKTNQLNEIIRRNNIWNFNNESNIQFRKIQRNNILNTFKLKNDWIHMNYRKGTICDKLNKFNTARIDIKNSGIKSNTLELVNISDENCSYHYPKWFENVMGEGKGLVIESHANFLDFTVRCVGNGELNLTLRGIDFRINGERIPIYITYTDLKINRIDIIKEKIEISHDKSFTFNLPVKNNEYITFSLSWEPID